MTSTRRILVAIAVLPLGLSCKGSDAGGTAASVAPASAAGAGSASASEPPPFGEGAHDYQGTLGGQPIAVHLVRAGGAVSGAYLYPSVGRPVALSGSIDAARKITLSEMATGPTTGTWHLQSDGYDLVGGWAGPGQRTLPIALSPGNPRPALLPPADPSPDAAPGAASGTPGPQPP